MVRFIGARIKDSLQVPRVLTMYRWPSSIPLWKNSSLWGCKPELVLTKHRKAQAQRYRISVFHFPICMSAAKAMLGPALRLWFLWRENTQVNQGNLTHATQMGLC